MHTLFRFSWIATVLAGCWATADASTPAGRVIRVGPNEAVRELHQLRPLNPGDRVEIMHRSEPYKAKLQIGVNRIQLVGIAGPNGELPIIDGADAREVGWASYWNKQIAQQGIITVTAGAGAPKVKNVVIEGLRIRGARNAGLGFRNASGKGVGWNVAAAGIALYKCENVTIRGCVISECDNGIFGKSYGNDAGDLKNIAVERCNIHTCGVPGSDRFHNSYIEGINTTYQFNNYGPPIEGASGCNLKDRGAGTVIAHNRFEGGVRILDLVEPEDGAASFKRQRSWGKTFVYGNVIINPPAGSATLVHFGFDGLAQNAQRELYFFHNTVVDINTLNTEAKTGRWYAYLFKTHGAGQKLHLANNIFHSFSPDPAHGSGEFRLLTEEYGTGTHVELGTNWFPSATQLGVAKPERWGAQLRGDDPKFTDAGKGDVSLKDDSPGRRKAVDLATLNWPLGPHSPKHTFSPDGTWPKRTSWNDLGASE